MESTVSSDLAECTPAPAAAALHDAGRIKSSPQSFDDSPDAGESAVAATSTTTDELSGIDLGASAASTCWPPPAAGRDNSQHYLGAAASYDCVTPALYSASQHDFVSMPRTSCYQPWCLSAEHYHHNLFT